MPYITLPIIFIICFAIAACIAHIHRGKVRRKKEVEQRPMPYIDNLFDSVEPFDLKYFVEPPTDAFDETELQGLNN